MKLTKSDFLTLSRIIFTPAMLILLNWDCICLRRMGFILFLALCATDFLDGYYARLSKTESKLGAILDPLADKWLVLSSMIFLAYKGMFSGYSLIVLYVLLFREIFVMELRIVAMEKGFSISSSIIAKAKTVFLMTGIGFLFLNIMRGNFCPCSAKLGIGLLWVGTALSIASSLLYLRMFFKNR